MSPVAKKIEDNLPIEHKGTKMQSRKGVLHEGHGIFRGLITCRLLGLGVTMASCLAFTAFVAGADRQDSAESKSPGERRLKMGPDSNGEFTVHCVLRMGGYGTFAGSRPDMDRWFSGLGGWNSRARFV